MEAASAGRYAASSSRSRNASSMSTATTRDTPDSGIVTPIRAPALPAAPEGAETHSIRLPPGTDFEAALDSLASAGAVRNATSLRLFGTLTGWGEQVKTGHYNLTPGMSNWAMLDKIRKGLQDPIRITIPGAVTPAPTSTTCPRDPTMPTRAS